LFAMLAGTRPPEMPDGLGEFLLYVDQPAFSLF
jgi:hypothetical protein